MVLDLQIVSSRIVDGENEKKYVAYTMEVRGIENDTDVVSVERRYTDFLDLYNGLKKDHAALLAGINFPRKVVVGNFDSALIKERCESFQGLLKLMTTEWRLRETPAAFSFFQDIELTQARKLISEAEIGAFYLLENSFKLLSKVYTPRSRVVLVSLCRLVASALMELTSLARPAEKWAQLALRRYEGVSDSDLLLLYVPLVHACISIWNALEIDSSKLAEELNDLRKRGMKIDPTPSLMDAVENLTPTI